MPDPDSTLDLAHALRTPLTSLALGLGLLSEGMLGPLSDAQREVVRTLVADVARLSLLVGRNLEIDRLGAYAGPVERVRADLGAIVESARAPLEEQAAARGIALSCDLDPGVTAVVDAVKMSWVVASLLGNAIRYSPAGSRVRVRLARALDEAEIAVTDEGPGMAPEVAARLFERGGGLGLLLVREIVEAHGGTISVASTPLRGSTFVIRLPAA
ncbi:MAG: HAMP domain-containing sensor histidine kinase [Minicystis sp.]